MIVMLDNGHGGVINGVYQTAGKRSPEWELGVLYEGVFNRKVVKGIIKVLQSLKIPYYHLCPEDTDVSLETRVSRANEFTKKSKVPTYILSIHANAGGGTGWEIFTTIGKTKADDVADVFIKYMKSLPIVHRADLSDGDGDKESNFFILKDSIAPAVLLECAFMDNHNDYVLMNDQKFIDKVIANCVNGIISLYKTSC